MNRRHFILLAAAGLTGAALADEDKDEPRAPGAEVLANIVFTVYYGTNDDPATAGQRATAVPADVEKRLAADPRLRFTHYRQLGRDVKPLYRSYLNWAKPLGSSDEILLRFEAQSLLANGVRRLDLELWQREKKILKTDIPLTPGQPLLVLGPQWRGGKLILAIELAPLPPRK